MSVEQKRYTVESIVKAAEALPQAVMGMKSLTPEELDKLEPRYFGLIYKRGDYPAIRKFPLIDAGNCYMSALQWGLAGNSLPDSARRVAAFFISQAAKKHGLTTYPFKDVMTDVVNTLAGIPATNIISDTGYNSETLGKLAKEDKVTYLLPDKVAYPVADARDVRVASSYFDQWGATMDITDQRAYATNLSKVAKELGENVSDFVKKYAAENRNPSLQFKIENRVDLTKEAGHKEAWGKIEKMAEQLDNETLIELMGMMDKTAGLDKYYGAVLSDPILSVVTTASMEKVAEEVGVTEEELRMAPHDKLKTYFGQGLADQFHQSPLVTYNSMGPEAQVLVRNLMQGLL